MAEEDIQKLHSEIESLRRENQRLRLVARHAPGFQEAGLTVEAPVLKKEPMLRVLSKQLSHLQGLNLQAKSMLEGYQEIQKSLAAILPALELQMEGWTNEVYNLKKHIEDSESAYAAVVVQLENKLGKAKLDLKKQASDQEGRSFAQLQKELDFYRGELRKYKKESPIRSRERENPFTSLSIFGP